MSIKCIVFTIHVCSNCSKYCDSTKCFVPKKKQKSPNQHLFKLLEFQQLSGPFDIRI